MRLQVHRAQKIAHISRSFCGPAHSESRHPSHVAIAGAETVWFTKAICILCARNQSRLDVFGCDYFRENLNPMIAFAVIEHISGQLNNTRLAFSFFQFARLNLSLVHSVSSFQVLLMSHCELGLHDSVRLLVDYMRADGYLSDRSVVEFVVLTLANAGNFEVAKEILISESHVISNGRCGNFSHFLLNKFVSLLMKKNRVDEAVSFFTDYILRSQSYCFDTCTFNIVIRGLCQAGRVDNAFPFFSSMEKYGRLPDLVTYNTLISGLCGIGDVGRAQSLLREIHLLDRFSPDVVTYTSVVSGFCKLGRMDEAVNLMEQMISSGIRPTVVTFNTLINGFGKIRDMVSAIKMYDRMCLVGCPPDVITFTSLINGHCQSGDLDHGLKLWNEMNEKKLFPNAYTFSIVIHALCQKNRITEACKILKQLKWRSDIVPKPFIYNPVVDGLCKSGNLEQANAIAADMEEKGCHHDKITFTILILGHCMKGRMIDAVNIFNKMLTLGCAPDKLTINCFTSLLLKAGMAKEAYRIKNVAAKDSRDVKPSSGTVLFNNIELPIAAYNS
ncbi:unnamed protein product [Cuscuta campestris]|uniref:Pentacotripeptide-repeat region of PRORP domain-containing protein n=1 Tax=Cuscuta campestris TaxID=132261 RepID=A0A484K313_9ASTE|nr:unnamed protein product [Cuscuta campestris]